MAVLKCKMCGGTLEVTNSEKLVTCEFCGTTQTIPLLDNEKRITLHNRANAFRLRNEFDKAIITYESIVEEFMDDAEAYWGLVLCKYGIEYVDDSELEEYSIVGSKEADPFLNKISNESPIAKAIMGMKIGDKVSVESPNGTYDVKIVKIA